MQIFYFIAAFLFLRRLRVFTKRLPIKAVWNNLLVVSMISVALLFFLGEKVFNDFFDGVAGLASLAGILYYTSLQPAFASFRNFIRAHFPLLIAGSATTLVQGIFPTFYNHWDNYFQIVVVGCFVWIFARLANTKKQQAELHLVNERRGELELLVAERTEELTRQKDELHNALEELKNTQAQLIQQEKLVSLGELTAGVAHEIQNPLNFVNNFSEVSNELIDEMNAELDKGDFIEAKAISHDIKQNLEKISQHGKRADAIVKGMLQHSRKDTGQKEPVDINALADEYLRLSYHGLRAKDKSFNADFKTDFDTSIGLIHIVPQDIGRVLLNLYNNAFYAVKHPNKLSEEPYKPLVSIKTSRHNLPSGAEAIEIIVTDNGNGIPQHIIDKIFQPFFTTKPTGEGTGLGLSLSYDIITKEHNGTIRVESKEGEGSSFIIVLPATV